MIHLSTLFILVSSSLYGFHCVTLVRIQLLSYSNPNRELAKGLMCMPKTCSFSFTLSVLSGVSNGTVATTKTFKLDDRGNASLASQKLETFAFHDQPVGLVALLHHSGTAFKRDNTEPVVGGSFLVDGYSVNLLPRLPSASAACLDVPVTVVGFHTHSRLSLRLGLQCADGLFGRHCNLSCAAFPDETYPNHYTCHTSAGERFVCRRSYRCAQAVECRWCAEDDPCLPDLNPVDPAAMQNYYEIIVISLAALVTAQFIALMIIIVCVIRLHVRERRNKQLDEMLLALPPPYENEPHVRQPIDSDTLPLYEKTPYRYTPRIPHRSEIAV